ncbi:hypothetical protein [Candidatus Bathycorpusculum sp.]|uniref:hypothetical protein n=1 Tax=Candidatus Bathycorpusculum sp. TaxID=2994959 RepID=UPI002831A057|nr:hypothetical protein [Candidatus Termitimicrobium sp.]MCL2686205.1 hypothetical protein [Candidatus Termitimicrobium sp.]
MMRLIKKLNTCRLIILAVQAIPTQKHTKLTTQTQTNPLKQKNKTQNFIYNINKPQSRYLHYLKQTINDPLTIPPFKYLNPSKKSEHQ